MATDKNYLKFSADKKSCWIVFASGSESLEIENMSELFEALKKLKERGKITDEEIKMMLISSISSDMDFVNGNGIKGISNGLFTVFMPVDDSNEIYHGFFKILRTGAIRILKDNYLKSLKGKEIPGFYVCPDCGVNEFHYHFFLETEMSMPVLTRAEAHFMADQYLENGDLTIEEKVLIDLQIDKAPIPEDSWMN